MALPVVLTAIDVALSGRLDDAEEMPQGVVVVTIRVSALVRVKPSEEGSISMAIRPPIGVISGFRKLVPLPSLLKHTPE
jgi:hypothetical protein